MNSGLEIHFTLLGVEFRLQIRQPRSAEIAIQEYEVAPAPFLAEIRRTLLRRLKARMRAELPAIKPGSRFCPFGLQCSPPSLLRVNGRFGF